MREYKVSITYTNDFYNEVTTIGDSDIEKYKDSIIQNDVFMLRLSNGNIIVSPFRHVRSIHISPKN